MMVLIFAPLFVAAFTAWWGRRRLTVSLSLFSLAVAVLWLWSMALPGLGLPS